MIGAGSSLVESYWKGGDFNASSTYKKAFMSGVASSAGSIAGGFLKGKSATQIENVKFGLTKNVLRGEVNQGLKAGVGGVVGGGLDIGFKKACGLD